MRKWRLIIPLLLAATVTAVLMGTGLIFADRVTFEVVPQEATSNLNVDLLHEITATYKHNGAGVWGSKVCFLIVSGPNKGLRGEASTDNSGIAEFSYQSNGKEGTDVIQARVVDDDCNTCLMVEVESHWIRTPAAPVRAAGIDSWGLLAGLVAAGFLTPLVLRGRLLLRREEI